jgi:DNA helicase-2/ATP-dependent DNA helicase PcrA
MENLLENLNLEQLEAVKHKSGPLLIVAGAGTGKTTVITRRIAYLIEQNEAKPNEILALTFTDKAAGEMQDRLAQLLPLGYYDMWISTFHSFCQRILEQHGLDIGLPGDFKLLNETRAWVLVYNNLEKFNLNYYRPLGNPKKFISAMLKHFSRCKDELITPEQYLEYAKNLKPSTDSTEGVTKKINQRIGKIRESDSDLSDLSDSSEILRITEIANAFHVYEKLLVDNGYLDFANLINFTIKLFEKRPQILQRYQNLFKFIMVDEFQDTNFSQYQLVKLLSGVINRATHSERSEESLSKSKERDSSAALGMVNESRCNITVVGDDDQSIYKFRGASVSNILKFQEDYPKLKQITLVENYRSSQEILDLAYEFMQANNPDRLEVKLKIDKRLKSQTKSKATIEVLEGKDLIEELNIVAKKIVELKAKNPEKSWNDFAILLRSNSAAQEILPTLNQYSIPNTFVANTGLYQKPFISNIIAYLKTLNNFHDSFALYRVLSFDEFKIQAKDLASLLEASDRKTLSLYEMLASAKDLPNIGQGAQKNIEKILKLLHEHAELMQKKSANELFVQIIHDLKFEKSLEEENQKNAEDRELLEQFYKKVETFVAENSDKSMHHFLYLLDLEIEAGDEGQIKFDPNLGPESLKVLTIHSAKGLEFEYVFIPNMVELRFPTRARGDQIEIPTPLIKDLLPEGDFHLQEERRLFYVAVTRAKSHLYFSWGRDYGGAKTKKPSVFLHETKLVPGPVTSQATGKVFFETKKGNEIIYKSLPKTFSFSALKAFENCPLQYKYQYYLKIPSPGSAYFSFGQTIHKVFELYLKDYASRKNQPQQDLFSKKIQTVELGDLKLLNEFYEKNWIAEWYKTKKQQQEYFEKGKELIKKFYGYTQLNPPNPKLLEKSFFLPLGDYKFTGKIDRADIKADGTIEIIDYKTSEKIPSKNDKGNLDQLHVYQWAAQEFFGETVGGMSYWYLQDNKFLAEPIASAEEILKLKQRLLETIEKIVQTIKYDNFKNIHAETKEHKCIYENLEP